MLGFCTTPLKIALCYEQLKKKKRLLAISMVIISEQ